MKKHCPTCSCFQSGGLTYGPVGDPNSTDPFERAQSQMPDGWHVEGQIIGGTMMATTRQRGRITARSPEKLVAKVRRAAAE